MSTIVNDNNLVYVITSYGLSRIAEALQDSSVTIEISKMKVGTGDNDEYYLPTEDQTALKGLIPDGEFYVLKKELLEDNQTVSFNCVIPETFSGYDIREVGLYETVNNEDKLFAIVVQQPIVKPKSEYGYYMAINYYMFLKVTDLRSIYDQIVLNPDNQLISEEDISNLLSTILFTQSNLSTQIGQNSEVIGYNRATEIYNFAETNRNSFGYMAACNSYASFANYVGRDNVFGYWIFDYPKRNEDYRVIKDIGPNGYNFSTSSNVTSFAQNYEGIMSTLVFPSPSYFYLDSSIPLSFVTEAAGADIEYYDVVGDPIISNIGVASNFSSSSYLKSKAIIDCTKTFKITFNEQRGETNRFYGFQLSITSNEAVPLFFVQSANTSNLTFGVYTNGTLHTVETNTFVHANYTNINYIVSWDGVVYKLEVEDALTHEVVKTLTYNSSTALVRSSSSNGVIIYGYNFNVNHAIQVTNLRQTSAYNDGVLLFDGSSVGIEDLSFTMFFVINPLSTENDITLLARSNYSVSSKAFEVKELYPSASLEVKLFADDSNYITFTTADNSVPSGCHSLILSYNKNDYTLSVYMNDKKVPVTKVVTGDYVHMFDSVTTLYGYACSPHFIKYTHTVDPTTSGDENLYNADGSPYVGTEWTVNQNQVYYNQEIANYDYNRNKLTDTLYSWVYDDGIEEHIIYTRTLNITESTILYNANYTEYTGLEFSVDFVSGSYKVLYSTYVTTNDGAKNINPITLYAWVYEGYTEKIWANSSSNPTILFNSDGSIYKDTEWTLEEGVITYNPTEEVAVYTSGYNVAVSKMDTTSCIINSEGLPEDNINSNVGILGIALNNMSEENMRVFSMELGAQIGLNPCISSS